MTRRIAILLLGALLSSLAAPAQDAAAVVAAKGSLGAENSRREIDRHAKAPSALQEQPAEEQRKQEEKGTTAEKTREERLGARSQEPHRVTEEETEPAVPKPDSNTSADRRTTEKNFALHVLSDQKVFWERPSRLRLADTRWLVPFGGLTAALIGSDTSIEGTLPTSPSWIRRSQTFSDYGAYSYVGLAGAAYLWGSLRHNDHVRETGLLSAEAVADSMLDVELFKTGFGRQRPLEGDGKGRFFQGGNSFPSEHSAAAWSVATVIAHEYPGFMTKLLAYGGASAISLARVLGRQHFSSDVFIGGALGWYMGREVYRAHHNPELNGAEWGTFTRAEGSRSPDDIGSTYVPLDSWIYPAFDRLIALGFAQSAFLNLRPWTRMECARLVEEVSTKLDPEESQAGQLYRALKEEFASEQALQTAGQVRQLAVESVYTRTTTITGQPLTDGYHFGQSIVNDFGRPYGEGFNQVTGLSTRAVLGPFAFFVRGEYQHAPALPTPSEQVLQATAAADNSPVLPPLPSKDVNQFRLLEAYVGMKLGKFELSFGKQSLWWGPSRSGGMLFSDNAEPIYMVRLNRVTPTKLPSILGWLGPMRTEFFIGRLSGHRVVNTENGPVVAVDSLTLDRQPYIHGEKISFKPTPNFEFSFSSTSIFAGPDFPFTWDRFFHTFTNNNSFGPSDPGDRRTAVDFSYRLPKLRDRVLLYADALADDQPTPLVYPRDSAFTAGIYLPRLPGLQKMDFRAEGTYTPFRLFPGFFYYNVRYFDGYTNKGQLLGNPIGRESVGMQFWTTYWFSPLKTIQLGYRQVNQAQEFLQGGHLQDFAASANWTLRPDLSLSGGLRYEKWYYPGLSPVEQNNVIASFQVTYWPRKWAVKW